MCGVIWCNLLPIFCQVKKMMALQNGLHQRGRLGQMLRGRLGHVVGWIYIYICNNNYALVYSFVLVGLRTPVHSRTCTRTPALTQFI